MKIKSLILAGLLLSSLAGNASAGCRFSWKSYGDNSTKELIGQNIGRHIPDEFCPLAASHKIIIQYHYYTLRDMCAGHAIVSLRKIRSDIQQANNYSSVITDTNCRSTDGARNLAAKAALGALDDLMKNLSDAVKAEI
jgi:hypothetical protein